MKTLTAEEAQTQLGQLIAEAHQGGVIVLTNGGMEVVLQPRVLLDPEEDTPELETELLKAAEGPFTSYSSEQMRAQCEQIVRGKRAK